MRGQILNTEKGTWDMSLYNPNINISTTQESRQCHRLTYTDLLLRKLKQIKLRYYIY